ncbi:uncharacterized protein LOC132719176 [Ruditapes philippinarum]|uniref:uncharacterized protein LOC132719176 n=1 Tax=Ruditapes philippinarum TaxID=129788 RepID=UPI00295B7D43|nr:uncharacterized protein LOC132719176 [Ruditapes philippinarum]
MAAKFELTTPGPFIVVGEQTNLSKAWEQYEKRFEIYIQAAGVTKDYQKRALLLHVGGSQIQDVFNSLGSPGTTYKDAADSLSNYFKPKKKIQYERRVFHQSKQMYGETIDNYVVRLSKLAVSCEFIDQDDQIRDHILESCASDDLRKKLLTTKNLTLERLQEVARTYELSDTHAKLMSNKKDDLVDEVEVNKLRSRSRRQAQPRFSKSQSRPQQHQQNHHQQRKKYDISTAKCYRCGDIGHYGKQCKKSVGVTCFKCGKQNHFAKLCKSKSVNFLETDNFDGYSSEEIYAISGKNAATLQIVLENKKVDVLIDSGSSVNIIDEHLFGKLK